MKRSVVILALAIVTGTLFSLSAQTNKVANLPQYVFPKFVESDALLKNGSRFSAPFNYNIVDEELVYFSHGTYMIPENPEAIDTVFISGRKFVPVGKQFYELICPGRYTFLLQHKGKYSQVGTATAYGMTSQTNAPSTITTVRVQGRTRTLEMPDNVQVTQSNICWIVIDGKPEKFTTFRQLMKLLPDKEQKIKDYQKGHSFDANDIQALNSLALYCNSLP